jgi:hypothetical protein
MHTRRQQKETGERGDPKVRARMYEGNERKGACRRADPAEPLRTIAGALINPETLA